MQTNYNYKEIHRGVFLACLAGIVFITLLACEGAGGGGSNIGYWEYFIEKTTNIVYDKKENGYFIDITNKKVMKLNKSTGTIEEFSVITYGDVFSLSTIHIYNESEDIFYLYFTIKASSSLFYIVSVSDTGGADIYLGNATTNTNIGDKAGALTKETLLKKVDKNGVLYIDYDEDIWVFSTDAMYQEQLNTNTTAKQFRKITDNDWDVFDKTFTKYYVEEDYIYRTCKNKNNVGQNGSKFKIHKKENGDFESLESEKYLFDKLSVHDEDLIIERLRTEYEIGDAYFVQINPFGDGVCLFVIYHHHERLEWKQKSGAVGEVVFNYDKQEWGVWVLKEVKEYLFFTVNYLTMEVLHFCRRTENIRRYNETQYWNNGTVYDRETDKVILQTGGR